MAASLLTSRRTYPAFMAGWTSRFLGLLVVIALAVSPTAGAACAWLCGPDGDADTAQQGHHDGAAAHCHDDADTGAPAISATGDTACPLHQASSAYVAMNPGGLRSDVGAFRIAAASMESLSVAGLAHVATPHALRTRHPRQRPPSVTPLVLRL